MRMTAITDTAGVEMPTHESRQCAESTSSIFSIQQPLPEIAALHILLGKARSVPFVAINASNTGQIVA